MSIKIVTTDGDVQGGDQKWIYSQKVKSHFFHPQNLVEDIATFDESEYDGMGIVGSPACGDVMKMWVKIVDDKVADCKWQTFGCASAIASTSMLSTMAIGMSVDDALKIKPQDILEELGGLPARKVHCSVLGDQALRKAINDHFRRSKQFDRIIIEGSIIVDPETKTTDRDIEEAVLEGADDIEKLQKKLKVTFADENVRAKAEALMKKFIDKYYG